MKKIAIIAAILCAGAIFNSSPALAAKRCCGCFAPAYSRYSSDKRPAIEKVRAYNYRHGIREWGAK